MAAFCFLYTSHRCKQTKVEFSMGKQVDADDKVSNDSGKKYPVHSSGRKQFRMKRHHLFYSSAYQAEGPI